MKRESLKEKLASKIENYSIKYVEKNYGVSIPYWQYEVKVPTEVKEFLAKRNDIQ